MNVLALCVRPRPASAARSVVITPRSLLYCGSECLCLCTLFTVLNMPLIDTPKVDVAKLFGLQGKIALVTGGSRGK
jgi:hypothetical protein